MSGDHAGPAGMDAPAELSERENVELWRFEQLLAAGYPLPLAEQLAARGGVDLHQAVELVAEQGCPHETAAAILL